jgi:hypothetical protein
MPVGIQVTFNEQASGILRTLSVTVTQGAMNQAAAGAVARLLQRHFRDRASERHKKAFGGTAKPAYNFYAYAARSVIFSATDNEARVDVPHRGIRQRLLGGRIVPVNAKWLAIPARPEAYGKRPREFDLEFRAFPKGGAALVMKDDYERLATRGKNAGSLVGTKAANKATHGAGAVMFWLVKAVVQDPDPSVMPPADQIDHIARQAVSDHLQAKLSQATARQDAQLNRRGITL